MTNSLSTGDLVAARLAVIFDLDGLLVDSEPLWAESARLLLGRRGIAADPALRRPLIGRPPLEVARAFVDHYGLAEQPEALAAERLQIMAALVDRGVPALPGAEGLTAALLSEGLPLAVASSTPQWLVERVLDGLGWRRRFSVVLGGDRVERGKPHPALFLLAASLLEMPPDRCVVLEDSPAGLRAARAAGMACVAVPGAEIPAEALPPADLVLESLEQLTAHRLAALVTGVEHDRRKTEKR